MVWSRNKKKSRVAGLHKLKILLVIFLKSLREMTFDLSQIQLHRFGTKKEFIDFQ